VSWPGGAHFAFTVFDDTDHTTIENGPPHTAIGFAVVHAESLTAILTLDPTSGVPPGPFRHPPRHPHHRHLEG